MRTIYRSTTNFYPLTKQNEGQIPNTADAVAISIINTGEDDLLLNGALTISPGNSFTVEQPHPDMYDKTNYSVSFVTAVNPNAVAVITKAIAIDPTSGGRRAGGEVCEKF